MFEKAKLIIGVICIVICIVWYVGFDKEMIVSKNNKRELNISQSKYSFGSNYTHDKRYFKEIKYTIKYKKSFIPLVFLKDTLSSKTTYHSRNRN